MSWIRELQSTGELEQTLSELRVSRPHDLVDKLEQLERSSVIEEHLKQTHHGVYLEALRATGRSRERTAFMKRCERLRDESYETYTQYVFGYLVPTVEEMRSQGELCKRKFIHSIPANDSPTSRQKDGVRCLRHPLQV